MKNVKFIALALLASACGQIQQDIAQNELQQQEEKAIDRMLGAFQGTVTVQAQYSALNLGLEDNVETSNASITIFQDTEGETVIQSEEGQILLKGISLAMNGSTFNIPEQEIADAEGRTYKIFGIQAAELDDHYYSGVFYIVTNHLNFGYQTSVNVDLGEYGIQNVPITLYYEMIKI